MYTFFYEKKNSKNGNMALLLEFRFFSITFSDQDIFGTAYLKLKEKNIALVYFITKRLNERLF